MNFVLAYQACNLYEGVSVSLITAEGLEVDSEQGFALTLRSRAEG